MSEFEAVEHEAIERALRIRLWNECKDRGMRDADAYKRINAEIEGIKTEARASTDLLRGGCD